jgi:hypothetical protein
MPSPFPANATLTFQIAGPGLVTDTKGNKVPASYEPLELEAYLKPDGRPRTIYYPGIDDSEEPLTGRLIEPPPPKLPNKGTIEIREVSRTRQGTFKLVHPTQSPFGVNEILGDRIYVVFRQQS